MFKSIKNAALSSGPLGAVFSAMELLQPLLKPLEIIMTIIGSLFTAMAAEILPPLMDALAPVFEMLIELTPLFQEIGTNIGELITEFLPPLVNILKNFMISLKPLIPVIMKIIKQIMDLALVVLPILINVFMTIANVALAVLKPILEWLSSLNAGQLSAVIYAFGLGLSALWGFLHMGGPWGAAIGAGLWAGFMTGPLLMGFGQGGVAMEPQVAMLAENEPELVAPLSPFNRRMDDMISAQEETNTYLRLMYEDKVFRHELRRGF
ncbi:hypothetical protein LCGC14_0371440 [marine sediment metagenome]|uniref:Phage tail tape measure protein domain-containing protein n=1 Tax=marine sediment metagenome TaxID=412755 RepID=A0A0F9TMZ3_9ZZZZ